MPELILALVPLDERPVNTRCPQMLGAIGGADVRLPPHAIRGQQRVPADLPALDTWLQGAARDAHAAIVSTDFWAYGNLINARISQGSAAQALARLGTLAQIDRVCPVHAFSLITRVANADDCVEEPGYWAQWGTRCSAFARRAHQAEQGALDAAGRREWEDLQAQIPPDARADWLTRRLRNHTVNLGLLDMAARGELTSLLLTSDDTAPYGFPSRERDWLRGWVGLVGDTLARRVMMHPGADEVGSALVARLLNVHHGDAPRVWPVYAIDEDSGLVAPYEDRPVRETVRGQIAACGCRLADGPADAEIILGVVTPSPRRTDYRPDFLDSDREARGAVYASFLSRLAEWQAQGVPVALADVAYPNGADPLFMEYLLADTCPLAPGALAAYGAWNTAGNTLGVVVAQASCALRVEDDPARREAQRVFLAHRFLEDWGYQSVGRRLARADAQARWGRPEPSPTDADQQGDTCAFAAQGLGDALARLQERGVGVGLVIEPGSVTLPWRRTFEIDFRLVAKPPPA